MLDPLRDPATEAPSTIDALRLEPDGSSNPLRPRHYEQAGFFIAERCALLIAVMPADEAPTNLGGTSRVVHFRLEGAFKDEESKVTVEASTHLGSVSTPHKPPSGPVWLIDPRSAASAVAPLLGVDLYLPGVEKLGRDTGSANETESASVLHDRKARLVDSLRLMSGSTR